MLDNNSSEIVSNFYFALTTKFFIYFHVAYASYLLTCIDFVIVLTRQHGWYWEVQPAPGEGDQRARSRGPEAADADGHTSPDGAVWGWGAVCWAGKRRQGKELIRSRYSKKIDTTAMLCFGAPLLWRRLDRLFESLFPCKPRPSNS